MTLGKIRKMAQGDGIKVFYGHSTSEHESFSARVTDVKENRETVISYPLIELEPLDPSLPAENVQLKHDPNHTHGKPYNLQWLWRRNITGASVLAIEML